MNALQEALRLDRQPRAIECFDNSNLQGADPVASCVVFRDGKPARKEYRHYNVKTVVGADDFASMREIVFRRYTRLMAEGAELPDLIVADGGKAQMGAIREVLEALGLDIPIAGLARTTGTARPSCSTDFRRCWSASAQRRLCSTSSPTCRRRFTDSPFRFTGRNEARPSSIANWSGSTESVARRSRLCCSISVP